MKFAASASIAVIHIIKDIRSTILCQAMSSSSSGYALQPALLSSAGRPKLGQGESELHSQLGTVLQPALAVRRKAYLTTHRIYFVAESPAVDADKAAAAISLHLCQVTATKLIVSCQLIDIEACFMLTS